MQKDFDGWNEEKKKINNKVPTFFCYQREIWWCSIGLNVGSEEDGKNELFERPVLILKILNKNMVRVVPLTSHMREGKNHVPITYNGTIGAIKLSQLKTVSTKRLTRRLYRLDDAQFEKIVAVLRINIV